MSESIHVPSQTVKRLRALAKLFVPVAMIAAGTAWTTTVTWFRTRTSAEEIRPEITRQIDEIRPLLVECGTKAKDALAQANTQHVQVYALQQTALTLATALVELHAQAEVERAYPHSGQLSSFIERARKAYAREFERQLTEHPNDLVTAVKLTRLKVWRPDRDD
jgi:hypothetical protein